ncbi:YezD family protein [Hydrogenibacillus schlegelii]|uniref:DUF2292 domain-containing protein n=2 Tax=Hydrogenibacillus schlegelii TaxID=1484 RepID=A0A132MGT5_HYDSH|nr:YezD family protein [Hydrogenibacillus schlegelii]KWW97052.1 hypothetical protein TR75_10830 [Hydrogenibacillus schlegelii]OAR04520.1 hypothetical protein SA87_10565 [Hydrogenibacillus schlegelii]
MSETIGLRPHNAWLECIEKALEGLEYGTVQITVHDGQIVQIDRTEKMRFPVAAKMAAKGRAAAAGMKQENNEAGSKRHR